MSKMRGIADGSPLPPPPPPEEQPFLLKFLEEDRYLTEFFEGMKVRVHLTGCEEIIQATVIRCDDKFVYLVVGDRKQALPHCEIINIIEELVQTT